jgi:hypothetical protein
MTRCDPERSPITPHRIGKRLRLLRELNAARRRGETVLLVTRELALEKADERIGFVRDATYRACVLRSRSRKAQP